MQRQQDNSSAPQRSKPSRSGQGTRLISVSTHWALRRLCWTAITIALVYFFGPAVLALVALMLEVIVVYWYPVTITLAGLSSLLFLWIMLSCLRDILRRRASGDQPGDHMLRVAQYLYSVETIQKVFVEAIGDLQTEYNEHMERGERMRAFWLLLKYRMGLLTSIVLVVSLTVLQVIIRTARK